MFPPERLPDNIFKPLNAAEFIQRVLLPETGLQLIKGDFSCGEEEALEIMRSSAIYGMGMFPDLGERDAIRTAIVEARARKRRKEIAREESGIFNQSDDDDETWDTEAVGPPSSSSTTTTIGSSSISTKKWK
jgi:RTC4-like domain